MLKSRYRRGGPKWLFVLTYKLVLAPALRLKDIQGQTSTALTPEQDYRVRVMGEEELELLRAAASQRGLELTSLNWILASLMNHEE